jgi:signal transduction histidine kinase
MPVSQPVFRIPLAISLNTIHSALEYAPQSAMAPRKKAQVAFASAVAVLLLSAIAAYFTIARLRESASWVVHTYQVDSSLGELEASISVLTRSRTGYALSGDEDLLKNFAAALPRVHERILEIKALSRDTPAQVALCDRLESATEQRIAIARQSIALKQSHPDDSGQQSALTMEGLNFGFQSAAIALQMREQEQALLKIRMQESNRLFILTVVILAATFALALILFFIHYRLLNGELKARASAEHAAREGEESLRHLTGRLLQMQDEERRRFSRELHDSLGQYLAGVKMSIDMFVRAAPDKRSDDFLENALQLVDQSISETRTISHLLHPPLLDEVGFASAAKWYVQGFSERSGIEVNMDIPDGLTRLPRPLELGLFRVLQESLTNIHRHSKSPKADVILKSSSREVVLQVKDYGQGMPAKSLRAFQDKGTNLGVGLTGMRERVRELAGNLDIQSGPSGTIVIAAFPLAALPLAKGLEKTASTSAT